MDSKKPLTLAMAIAALGVGTAVATDAAAERTGPAESLSAEQVSETALRVRLDEADWGSFSREAYGELLEAIRRQDAERLQLAGDGGDASTDPGSDEDGDGDGDG